ncbi:hypothetical protein Clacol_007365 [Clathrus columnatus]|uniref:Uncharacterized protein n=1 Tax=Clathrus columnatus TaxID=1419009 RepID=A0AAV5AJR9_9AGAM|nr:hypothetical protein Clacol_007365 [Clathrus columnatus]
MSTLKNIESTIHEEELIHLRRQSSEKDNQISLVQNELLKKGNELQQLQTALNEALAKFRLEANRTMELESELERCNEGLRSERFARNNVEVSLRAAVEKLNSEEQSKRHLELELENYASRTSTQHEQSIKRLRLDKQDLEYRLRVAEAKLQEEKIAQSSKPNTATDHVNIADTFESQVKELQNKLSLTQQDLTETSRSLSVARKEAERANRLQNELITAHNAKMQAETLLKREKVELESIKEQLQDQIEELQYWRSAYGHQMREDDNSGAKIQELEQVRKELEDSRTREIMLKKKLEIMEARETELVMEREEALDELNELKEIPRGSVHNNSSAEQELKERLEEKDIALRKSREYANELQQIYKETLKACDMAEARVEELERQLQSLTPDPPPLISFSFLAQPTHEMTPQDEASILRLLTAVDRLRSERDSLRRAVHFTSVEHRISLDTAQEQLAEKDKEIIKLQNELETLRQQLDNATTEGITELLRFKDEVEIWRKKFENLESERIDDSRANKTDLKIIKTHLEEVKTTYRRTNQALAKSSRLGVVASILIRHLSDKVQELNGCWAENERDQLGKIKDKEEELIVCCLEKATLQAQLADATKELETRSDCISTLHSEIQEFKIQNLNLQYEINERKEELLIAKGTQAFEDTKDEGDPVALRLRITTLEQRVMRRTEQIGILQHDSKRLETNLRVAEETIMELSGDLEDTKRNCECLVDDCAQARKERDDALHKLENLETELETLQADQDQKIILEGSLRQANTEIAKQTKTIEGLVGAAFDSTTKLRSLNSLYTRATSQFGALKVQMSTLEGQYAHSLAENERLTSRIESMEVALVEQTDEIDKCKQDLLSAHTEIRRLLKALEELGTQRNHLENQLLQQEQKQVVVLEALQVELTESRELLATNKKELESIRKDKENSHQSLQSLREKDNSSTAEITRLNLIIHELQAVHNSTLISLKQNSDDDRLRLQTELEASRTVVSDLREEHLIKIQTLEKKLATTESLLQTAELSRGHHKAEIERVRSESTEEILTLQSRIEEEKAAKIFLEAELQSTSNSVTELENHIATAVTRYESEIQNLKTSLSKAHEQIDEQIEARRLLQHERTAWESQRVQIEAELERSTTRYEYAEQQYKKSEHELHILESKVQQLRDQVIKFEEAAQTAETALIAMQCKPEKGGNNDQYEEIMAEFREKIEYLEEVLQMKSTEIEENDDRFIEVLKDKKRLQGRIDSLDRKHRALQTKFENITAKNEELVRENGDLLAKLKKLGHVSDEPQQKTGESAAVSQGVFRNIPHRLDMVSDILSSQIPSPSSSGSLIRPPTRIPSSPAAALRAKTPEPPQQRIGRVPDVPLIPSFGAHKIQSNIVSSRTVSHLQPTRDTDTPLSIVHSASFDVPLSSGRKRRLPDDFDSPVRVPVQVMVASSEDSKPYRTTPPRQSRRPVGNDSKGFTPTRRTHLEPQPQVGPSSLLRRSIVPLGEVTNSPRDVRQPQESGKSSITSDITSAGVTKAATKSWLNKSRMLLGKNGRSVTIHGTGQNL